jgi:hypothetical protein
MSEALTLESVLNATPRWIDEFERSLAGADYESKGVLFSEMLFVEVGIRLMKARRVVESGRARGQSTLVLAQRLPGLPIVSYEFDPHSPDVPVAGARLAPYPAVALRFGDATKALPPLVQAGDAVLIDGPKGFRAVRLALALLAQGGCEAVFVHDMCVGTLERAFLDAHVPGVFYSDDPRFVALASRLDDRFEDAIPAQRRRQALNGRSGYGFSMACLPRMAGVSYRTLQLRCMLAGLMRRFSSQPSE